MWRYETTQNTKLKLLHTHNACVWTSPNHALKDGIFLLTEHKSRAKCVSCVRSFYFVHGEYDWNETFEFSLNFLCSLTPSNIRLNCHWQSRFPLMRFYAQLFPKFESAKKQMRNLQTLKFYFVYRLIRVTPFFFCSEKDFFFWFKAGKFIVCTLQWFSSRWWAA